LGLLSRGLTAFTYLVLAPILQKSWNSGEYHIASYCDDAFLASMVYAGALIGMCLVCALITELIAIPRLLPTLDSSFGLAWHFLCAEGRVLFPSLFNASLLALLIVVNHSQTFTWFVDRTTLSSTCSI
jgi:hypothetical protein